MVRAFIGLSALVLSGCATSEVAYMRNASGMTVQCGPYQALRTIYAPADFLVDRQLRDCIEDYHQRQGYQRVAVT